ncbi:hypothetical protein B0H63DRAFT_515612 [Podospora didyma]|uniref:Reductase n=1 Tax=Podospora didyma TaxID=330526 RepID=A0AAE0N3B3_9PEZI|nr:hypothetical protein B0H63DRAFT_515612 [Podospora didyma]
MSPNFEASSLFSVKGMVAVVTGGGTGIGLTMAQALASNGAQKVYILGRRLEVLKTAAASSNPSILVPIQCDVTSKDSLQAAVDQITRETGFVNLLVANSGVLGSPNSYGKPGTVANVSELRKALFEEHSMEQFTDALHVNVTGAFFTMTAFLELLDAGNKNALKGGFGAPLNEEHAKAGAPGIQSQVIVTSSIAAYSKSPMSTPSYASSKAAVMHLTKTAAGNLARFGIRANALAPGLFPSELAGGMIGSRTPETESVDDPRYIPVRRFGTEEEMAGTLLYLASRAGAYCNGSAIVMDGGRLAVMPASY